MTSKQDSSRQVMLVTGASSGIGLAAAQELARSQATVVLHSRDADRGEVALRQVREAAGHDRVYLILADFSDLDSLIPFSESFRQQYGRLDVLVNNAGIIVPERRETRQGLEMQFGVNHIAPFLLTGLMADLLRRTPAARVVNVASAAHFMGRIHFNDLNLKHGYRPFKAYSQSKLANLLFTRELNRRLADADVSVSSCHPGLVATRFGVDRENPHAPGFMQRFKFIYRTPQQGAETPVALALTDLGEQADGRYYANRKKAYSSPRARNDVDAARLWQISEDIVRPWLSDQDY